MERLEKKKEKLIWLQKQLKFYKVYENLTPIKAGSGQYLPLPETATGENDF